MTSAAPDQPESVNPGLTPNRLARKRPKKDRETPEYADMVERMITAYGRRVGAGDVEELPRMIEMHRKLDEAIATAVAGLRDFGYSWAEIAKRTGTTRQAAQQRWGRPCP
jgi:hypothetical protein